MLKIRNLKLTLAVAAAVTMLSGCATHSDKLGFADSEGTKTYADAYAPARQMLLDGQWDQMRAKLNENATREVKEESKAEDGEVRQTSRVEKLTNEEEKERLIKEQSELAIVERGLLTLNTGDFERALFYFDAAEQKLDLAEVDDSAASVASSIGKTGMAALLGAEEMANYELKGYEKVMLLNYKALCYMLMGDRKAYNVTRRAIDLQQAEWEKFKKLLAENADKLEEQARKMQIEQEQKAAAATKQQQMQMNLLDMTLKGYKDARENLKTQLATQGASMNDAQRQPLEQTVVLLDGKIAEAEARRKSLVASASQTESPNASSVDDRDDEIKRKAGLVTSAYVNPFADYLNAMMMEIDGLSDPTMRQNAKIAYNKVVENNKQCGAARLASKTVEKGLPPNTKLVQVLLSDGFSPVQVEKTKIIPIQTKDRVIKAVVNYSNATPVPTLTAGARLQIGPKTRDLSSLTRMESLVLRDEADRMPIRATMFALAILRSSTAGAFLGDLGSALAGAVQHPDTRSWLTLPNTVYVAREPVPKHINSIKLETVDAEGNIVASTPVKLAPKGPTVVYAVSYDKNIKAYANAFSWVD